MCKGPEVWTSVVCSRKENKLSRPNLHVVMMRNSTTVKKDHALLYLHSPRKTSSSVISSRIWASMVHMSSKGYLCCLVWAVESLGMH